MGSGSRHPPHPPSTHSSTTALYPSLQLVACTSPNLPKNSMCVVQAPPRRTLVLTRAQPSTEGTGNQLGTCNTKKALHVAAAEKSQQQGPVVLKVCPSPSPVTATRTRLQRCNCNCNHARQLLSLHALNAVLKRPIGRRLQQKFEFPVHALLKKYQRG
jgi:hypothetical protein